MDMAASNASTSQIRTLLSIIFFHLATSIDFNYPAVFNFGDSNSDTGNIVAGVGAVLNPPNGQTYFGELSGRFCDGRLIIDFLMDAMELPFLNPYLDAIGAPTFGRGCNFAAAGASILPPTALTSSFSFGIQVAQFCRFKAKVEDIQVKTRELDKYVPVQNYVEEALYMFDIGHNDLKGAFYYYKTLDQVLASIPTMIQEFEGGIQKLYNQGARRFWIHNTGPLGCLPEHIAQFITDPSKLDELGCVTSHNQASRVFNLQLHALCKKLQGKYPDAKVTCVDIFTIKLDLIANYSRYGFEEPLMACCGYGGPPVNYDSRIHCGQTEVVNGSRITAKGCNDSTKYVNWDGIHYTEAANQYVASQILTGKYTDPPFADEMPFFKS